MHALRPERRTRWRRDERAMTETAPAAAPDALLLIAPGCPYCATVLAALGELVKSGAIARLEVVNLAQRSEIARSVGVRTVPWLRLGPFELEGLRSLSELKRWAERAGTKEGMADYFDELLRDGKLEAVLELLARDPTQLGALLHLIERPDTDLQVRVGVSAIMEEYEGHAALQDLVARLGALTRHKNAHVRGDAAHYLSLTHDPRAVFCLQSLRHD